jgi:hypothetical protein
MGSGATTTISGGALNIVGVVGFDTTIANQGAGTFAFLVQGGTFNAQYYSLSNMNTNGLYLTGSTTLISSLTEGNFTLAVNGGSLITVASSTLNYNTGLTFTGNSFATTTAITGANVTIIGSTPSAWTFSIVPVSLRNNRRIVSVMMMVARAFRTQSGITQVGPNESE